MGKGERERENQEREGRREGEEEDGVVVNMLFLSYSPQLLSPTGSGVVWAVNLNTLPVKMLVYSGRHTPSRGHPSLILLTDSSIRIPVSIAALD